MIDCIAIIDNKEMCSNSKDFRHVVFDSILAVNCCLPELLVCLLLIGVWLAGIEIIYRFSFNFHLPLMPNLDFFANSK